MLEEDATADVAAVVVVLFDVVIIVVDVIDVVVVVVGNKGSVADFRITSSDDVVTCNIDDDDDEIAFVLVEGTLISETGKNAPKLLCTYMSHQFGLDNDDDDVVGVGGVCDVELLFLLWSVVFVVVVLEVLSFPSNDAGHNNDRPIPRRMGEYADPIAVLDVVVVVVALVVFGFVVDDDTVVETEEDGLVLLLLLY